MSLVSQLISVATEAGCFVAYARAGAREHEAASSCPELAVRLAAAGVHRLQLVDVKAAERVQAGTWRVTFRPGSFVGGFVEEPHP